VLDTKQGMDFRTGMKCGPCVPECFCLSYIIHLYIYIYICFWDCFNYFRSLFAHVFARSSVYLMQRRCRSRYNKYIYICIYIYIYVDDPERIVFVDEKSGGDPAAIG